MANSVINNYKPTVESDPLGALKTILSTSVGLIPDVGPFLALGVNLFFPNEGNDGNSVLFKEMETEMHREISSAIYQESLNIIQILNDNPKIRWTHWLENDFLNPTANPDVAKFCKSTATVPQLNLSELSGDMVCALAIKLCAVYNNCLGNSKNFNLAGNRSSYQLISELISFGSFHISIAHQMLITLDYLKNNHPQIYASKIKGTPNELMNSSDATSIQKSYANSLRSMASELRQQITDSFSLTTIKGDSTIPFDALQYDPLASHPTAFGSDPQIVAIPELYDDGTSLVVTNYKKLKVCGFYNFVAGTVLPILFYWEQGLRASDIKPTSLNPDIPFPVKPAKLLPTFHQYLYKLDKVLIKNYSFDQSNPSKHADINTDKTSNVTVFEDCHWIQWGDRDQNDQIGLFDVYIDYKGSWDEKDYRALTPGAITTTPTDDQKYQFESGVRGYYLRAEVEKDSTVEMPIYLVNPKNVADSYDGSRFVANAMNSQHTMPIPTAPGGQPFTPTAVDLVGTGTTKKASHITPYGPKVDNSTTTFTNIPTGYVNKEGGEWGAKLFDPKDFADVYKVGASCIPPQQWQCAPNWTVSTPFDINNIQLNPAARFPLALIFGVVLYQVDHETGLIQYQPLANGSNTIHFNPALPLYVAVNDVIGEYHDNSGDIGLRVNLYYSQPLPLNK